MCKHWHLHSVAEIDHWPLASLAGDHRWCRSELVNALTSRIVSLNHRREAIVSAV
jgi:hypothetical protein